MMSSVSSWQRVRSSSFNPGPTEDRRSIIALSLTSQPGFEISRTSSLLRPVRRRVHSSSNLLRSERRSSVRLGQLSTMDSMTEALMRAVSVSLRLVIREPTSLKKL